MPHPRNLPGSPPPTFCLQILLLLMKANYSSSTATATANVVCSPLEAAEIPYQPVEFSAETSLRIAFAPELLLQYPGDTFLAATAAQFERCNGGTAPPFCLIEKDTETCHLPIRIELDTVTAPWIAILIFPSSVFDNGNVALFSRGGVFAWPGDDEDYVFPAGHIWTLGAELCSNSQEEEASPLCASVHFTLPAPKEEEEEEDVSSGATETSRHASFAIDGAASSPAAVALDIAIVAADLDVGIHTVSIETSDIDHDGSMYTLLATIIKIDVHVYEVPRIKYALEPTVEIVYGAHEEQVPMLQQLTEEEKWEAAVPSTGADFENFLRTNNGRLVGNVDWHYKLEDHPFPDFDTDTWTMAQVEDYIDAKFILENDVEQVRFWYDKYTDSWLVYQKAGFLCEQCDARSTLCNKCTATEHILVRETANPFRVYGLDAIDSGGASVAGGSSSHVQPGNMSVSGALLLDDHNTTINGSGNEDGGNNNGATQIGIVSGVLSRDMNALTTASSAASNAVAVLADPLNEDANGDTNDWAVVPRSQVGTSSCGMLGVNRAAFLAQTDKCNAESESCTGPRIANLVSESARANIAMTSGAHLERSKATPVLVLEVNAQLNVAINLIRGNSLLQPTPNSLIFAEPRLHQLGASPADVSTLLGASHCQSPAVTLTGLPPPLPASDELPPNAEGSMSVVLHNYGDAAGIAAVNISCTDGVTLLLSSAPTHVLEHLIEAGNDVTFTFNLTVNYDAWDAVCTLTATIVQQELWSLEGKVLPMCSLDVSTLLPTTTTTTATATTTTSISSTTTSVSSSTTTSVSSTTTTTSATSTTTSVSSTTTTTSVTTTTTSISSTTTSVSSTTLTFTTTTLSTTTTTATSTFTSVTTSSTTSVSSTTTTTATFTSTTTSVSSSTTTSRSSTTSTTTVSSTTTTPTVTTTTTSVTSSTTTSSISSTTTATVTPTTTSLASTTFSSTAVVILVKADDDLGASNQVPSNTSKRHTWWAVGAGCLLAASLLTAFAINYISMRRKRLEAGSDGADVTADREDPVKVFDDSGQNNVVFVGKGLTTFI